MAGFRVVLDACSIVPIARTDLLLTFAQHKVYFPLWSREILGEVERAIVTVSGGKVPMDRAKARTARMCAAFEDALVVEYEPLVAVIDGLPDPDDRHVVAAAIRGRAEAIVTDNVKDFPDSALAPWGLHAVTPDDFLRDLHDLDPVIGEDCLAEVVARFKNPPRTVCEFLDAMRRAGAPIHAAEQAQAHGCE